MRGSRVSRPPARRRSNSTGLAILSARAMLSRLKVYGGADHPHAAQKPMLVEKLIR